MSFLRKLFGVAFVAALTPASVDADPRSLVVVELFTSQGCSSCPPADQVLRDLKQRDDVLAFSQHVPYWDYIGWEDPFSLPIIETRQRAYAKSMKLSYVYTPQMVIQGKYQGTGSNQDKMTTYVDQAKLLPKVSFTATRNGGGLEVHLPDESPVEEEVEILLIAYDDQHKTTVLRGENGGKTLSHHNVVRRIDSLGVWSGGALHVNADWDPAWGELAAVILQAKKSRRIWGAAKVASVGS